MLGNLRNYLFIFFLVLFACRHWNAAPSSSLFTRFSAHAYLPKGLRGHPEPMVKRPQLHGKGKITNDGVVSTYELETVYGPLIVESTVLLLKRLHELRELCTRWRCCRKVMSLLTQPKKPLWVLFYTAKNLVIDPVRTMSEVGNGIGRFFKRLNFGTANDDPYRANALASALGQVADEARACL